MAFSDNGVASVTTKVIKIDGRPPTRVVGSASRPPDHNGWYNHPVTVRWSGDDSVAGIAFCTSLTYDGPDRAGVTLKGSCTDAAGNRSSVSRFVLKYDDTPPRLGEIVARRFQRSVSLRWSASQHAHFLITRSPGGGGLRESVVYRGARPRFSDRAVKSGSTYRYTLTAIDRAGNTAAKTVTIAVPSPLFAPQRGARLRSPRSILFSWEAAPNASYYNLQLWTGGEKVLSTWPSVARFRLVTPWTYAGVRRYLRPGRYIWYVWPASGPRSLGSYRPLLGSSTFFVTR
jgi:hypothetical protein